MPALLFVPMEEGRAIIFSAIAATGVVSALAYWMTRRGHYLLPVMVTIASSLLQHVAISTVPGAEAVIPFVAPVYLLTGSLCLSLNWLPLVYLFGLLSVLSQWYLSHERSLPQDTDPGPFIDALTLISFTAAIVWIGVRGFEQAIVLAKKEEKCV